MKKRKILIVCAFMAFVAATFFYHINDIEAKTFKSVSFINPKECTKIRKINIEFQNCLISIERDHGILFLLYATKQEGIPSALSDQKEQQILDREIGRYANNIPKESQEDFVVIELAPAELPYENAKCDRFKAPPLAKPRADKPDVKFMERQSGLVCTFWLNQGGSTNEGAVYVVQLIATEFYNKSLGQSPKIEFEEIVEQTIKTLNIR